MPIARVIRGAPQKQVLGGRRRAYISAAPSPPSATASMDLETRVKAYRFVAYSAVTFSVVAVLSVCVTLPMVYNYVHHVKRSMHSEINFCKVSLQNPSFPG